MSAEGAIARAEAGVLNDTKEMRTLADYAEQFVLTGRMPERRFATPRRLSSGQVNCFTTSRRPPSPRIFDEQQPTCDAERPSENRGMSQQPSCLTSASQSMPDLSPRLRGRGAVGTTSMR